MLWHLTGIPLGVSSWSGEGSGTGHLPVTDTNGLPGLRSDDPSSFLSLVLGPSRHLGILGQGGGGGREAAFRPRVPIERVCQRPDRVAAWYPGKKQESEGMAHWKLCRASVTSAQGGGPARPHLTARKPVQRDSHAWPAPRS